MPGQNVKKRNWTFLVYPESAPADWVSKLQATGLPVAISPLHDKDINPTESLRRRTIMSLFVIVGRLHTTLFWL